MSENFMSQRTAELLLLLSNDGVDEEELRALATSAFEDGMRCRIGRIGDGDEPGPGRVG
ncbi:MAG: hypothetical protein JSU82_17360 [Rhodospirillales bacterium]|nr:MAG: hypothetical protein JSU82_17360 [Rhodospirillales bacterium]